MHADLNFKLVRIIYTMRKKKKCMYRISSNRRPGGECIFKIGGVN